MFNLIFYTMIKAINTEYQGQVEEAFELAYIYNEFDNRRTNAEAQGDDVLYRVYDEQCERVFNEMQDAFDDLPTDEVSNISRVLYS